MKNKTIAVCIFMIFLVSIGFGSGFCLIYQQHTSDGYNAAEVWTDYVVYTRLVKQYWISVEHAEYLERLANNEDVLDEFIGYSKAVLEFSNPEIVEGANLIKASHFENEKEIKRLLHKICQSGSYYYSFSKAPFKSMSHQDLVTLQSYYEELAALLNINEQEDSLTYYVMVNDFDSAASKEKQEQVLEIIKNIDQLLGNI